MCFASRDVACGRPGIVTGGLLLLPIILLVAGCEREERAFQPDPTRQDVRLIVAQSPLSPGPSGPERVETRKGKEFENNAYHVNQGKQWFKAMNCNGCHGNGGGGSGPALMDDTWIYGGAIENIVQTIREGRPNGMPSFRGKIPDDQIWEIAAYVRSLSGQLRIDVAPNRSDGMTPHAPESRLPQMGPDSGTIPPGAERP
jgi:cytochrome c oxidase cbb3-type subunit 3